MPINPTPPDERPASPPLHQSLWFPVAPESAPEVAHDEPDAPPPSVAPPPPVNGLGWKAPRRVRVPLFALDAAQENTTPAAPPAIPRVPTANDETIRQQREHIVPPGLVVVDDEYSGPTAAECAARFTGFNGFSVAPMPPDDPDFQEVRRQSAPEPEPPEGSEAAHAPSCEVPVDRDDVTPNDGVVPQGIHVSIDGGGQDDRCSFALWSNGTFTVFPSGGEPLVLTAADTREMLCYVTEMLSARARAPA